MTSGRPEALSSPQAVVDVVICSLYQKAISNLKLPSAYRLDETQKGKQFQRRCNNNKASLGYTGQRARLAGAEKQMKLDMIGKLTTVFETSGWENAELEPLVTYRFCFTIRLYLMSPDSDFRVAALRLLRHAVISDRVLQMYCDLFIPDFTVQCLLRLPQQAATPADCYSNCTFAMNGKSEFGTVDRWCLEERVSALKLIRLWISYYVSKITIVPIPIIFFHALVAVSSGVGGATSGTTGRTYGVGVLPDSSRGTNATSRRQLDLNNIDPLRIFCTSTLRDIAVNVDVPTLRRATESGAISAIADAASDADFYEIERKFGRSLLIALSGIFGDDDKRLAVASPMHIASKNVPGRLVPQVTLSFDAACLRNCRTHRPPYWWSIELSTLSAGLLEVLTASPKMGYGEPMRHIFYQEAASAAKVEARYLRREAALAAEQLRARRWKASSAALLTLCRTFSGLLAVIGHPAGLSSLIELLWQPIDLVARLRVVEFFGQLLAIGLRSRGRPIRNNDDMYGLLQGCLTQSTTENNWLHQQNKENHINNINLGECTDVSCLIKAYFRFLRQRRSIVFLGSQSQLFYTKGFHQHEWGGGRILHSSTVYGNVNIIGPNGGVPFPAAAAGGQVIPSSAREGLLNTPTSIGNPLLVNRNLSGMLHPMGYLASSSNLQALGFQTNLRKNVSCGNFYNRNLNFDDHDGTLDIDCDGLDNVSDYRENTGNLPFSKPFISTDRNVARRRVHSWTTQRSGVTRNGLLTRSACNTSNKHHHNIPNNHYNMHNSNLSQMSSSIPHMETRRRFFTTITTDSSQGGLGYASPSKSNTILKSSFLDCNGNRQCIGFPEVQVGKTDSNIPPFATTSTLASASDSTAFYYYPRGPSSQDPGAVTVEIPDNFFSGFNIAANTFGCCRLQSLLNLGEGVNQLRLPLYGTPVISGAQSSFNLQLQGKKRRRLGTKEQVLSNFQHGSSRYHRGLGTPVSTDIGVYLPVEEPPVYAADTLIGPTHNNNHYYATSNFNYQRSPPPCGSQDLFADRLVVEKFERGYSGCSSFGVVSRGFQEQQPQNWFSGTTAIPTQQPLMCGTFPSFYSSVDANSVGKHTVCSMTDYEGFGPVVSSLWALTSDDSLVRQPDELCTAASSGSEFGASTDLRDIYGVLLLRVLLQSGLLGALAGTSVDLRDSQVDSESTKHQALSERLMTESSRLLALLTSAASFMLPHHNSNTSGSRTSQRSFSMRHNVTTEKPEAALSTALATGKMDQNCHEPNAEHVLAGNGLDLQQENNSTHISHHTKDQHPSDLNSTSSSQKYPNAAHLNKFKQRQQKLNAAKASRQNRASITSFIDNASSHELPLLKLSAGDKVIEHLSRPGLSSPGTNPNNFTLSTTRSCLCNKQRTRKRPSLLNQYDAFQTKYNPIDDGNDIENTDGYEDYYHHYYYPGDHLYDEHDGKMINSCIDERVFMEDENTTNPEFVAEFIDAAVPKLCVENNVKRQRRGLLQSRLANTRVVNFMKYVVDSCERSAYQKHNLEQIIASAKSRRLVFRLSRFMSSIFYTTGKYVEEAMYEAELTRRITSSIARMECIRQKLLSNQLYSYKRLSLGNHSETTPGATNNDQIVGATAATTAATITTTVNGSNTGISSNPSSGMHGSQSCQLITQIPTSLYNNNSQAPSRTPSNVSALSQQSGCVNNHAVDKLNPGVKGTATATMQSGIIRPIDTSSNFTFFIPDDPYNAPNAAKRQSSLTNNDIPFATPDVSLQDDDQTNQHYGNDENNINCCACCGVAQMEAVLNYVGYSAGAGVIVKLISALYASRLSSRIVSPTNAVSLENSTRSNASSFFVQLRNSILATGVIDSSNFSEAQTGSLNNFSTATSPPMAGFSFNTRHSPSPFVRITTPQQQHHQPTSPATISSSSIPHLRSLSSSVISTHRLSVPCNFLNISSPLTSILNSFPSFRDSDNKQFMSHQKPSTGSSNIPSNINETIIHNYNDPLKWNWDLILRLLMNGFPSNLTAILTNPISIEFIHRLTLFFLPKSFQFSLLPWTPATLPLATVGLHLILFITMAESTSYPLESISTFFSAVPLPRYVHDNDDSHYNNSYMQTAEGDHCNLCQRHHHHHAQPTSSHSFQTTNVEDQIPKNSDVKYGLQVIGNLTTRFLTEIESCLSLELEAVKFERQPYVKTSIEKQSSLKVYKMSECSSASWCWLQHGEVHSNVFATENLIHSPENWSLLIENDGDDIDTDNNYDDVDDNDDDDDDDDDNDDDNGDYENGDDDDDDDDANGGDADESESWSIGEDYDNNNNRHHPRDSRRHNDYFYHHHHHHHHHHYNFATSGNYQGNCNSTAKEAMMESLNVPRNTYKLFSILNSKGQRKYFDALNHSQRRSRVVSDLTDRRRRYHTIEYSHYPPYPHSSRRAGGRIVTHSQIMTHNERQRTVSVDAALRLRGVAEEDIDDNLMKKTSSMEESTSSSISGGPACKRTSRYSSGRQQSRRFTVGVQTSSYRTPGRRSTSNANTLLSTSTQACAGRNFTLPGSAGGANSNLYNPFSKSLYAQQGRPKPNWQVMDSDPYHPPWTVPHDTRLPPGNSNEEAGHNIFAFQQTCMKSSPESEANLQLLQGEEVSPSYGTASPKTRGLSTSDTSSEDVLCSRIFSREYLQSRLSREYSVFLGAMTCSPYGLTRVLQTRCFPVIYELIHRGQRDDLTLLFLKQLHLNFVPCRALIEQVVLTGTTTGRLNILRHLGLLIEGRSVGSIYASSPSLQISRRCPVRERGDTTVVCPTASIHHCHQHTLSNSKHDQQQNFASYKICDPGSKRPSRLCLTCRQRGRSLRFKDTISSLSSITTTCLGCGLPLEPVPENTLLPKIISSHDYINHPIMERRDSTDAYVSKQQFYDDFLVMRNATEATTVDANMSGGEGQAGRHSDLSQQGPSHCHHSNFFHESNSTLQRLGYVSPETVNKLIAKQPLWEWLLNLLSYLVFTVEFTPQKSQLYSSPTDFDNRDSMSSLSFSHSGDLSVSSISSSTRLPHLHSHRNRRHGRRHRHTKTNNCFGFCKYRSSTLVAETALHLVTELCKQGGGPIVTYLLPYLPDSRGRILVPMPGVGTETELFHCYFSRYQPSSHLHYRHQHYHERKERCMVSERRSCCLSLLKDWPSALKVQLLHLEEGAAYLIQSGWFQEQLERYALYAHNQTLDTSRITSGSIKKDSDDLHIRCRRQNSFGGLQDQFSGLPNNTKNGFVFDRTDTHDSTLTLPTLLANDTEQNEANNVIGSRWRRYSQPQLNYCYLYVFIIDTLMESAFWEDLLPEHDNDITNPCCYSPFTSISSLKIPDASLFSRPTKLKLELRPIPLILPDPRYYHFLYANKFQKDRFAPSFDALSKSSHHSYGTKSKCAPTKSNRAMQQNVNNNDTQYDYCDVGAQKREIEHQHLLSPLEFLSYVPFNFVIQIVCVNNKSATFDGNSSNCESDSGGNYNAAYSNPSLSPSQTDDTCVTANDSTYDRNSIMEIENVNDENGIQILQETVVDASVVRRVDPALYTKFCQVFRLYSSSPHDNFAHGQSKKSRVPEDPPMLHPPLFIPPSICAGPFSVGAGAIAPPGSFRTILDIGFGITEREELPLSAQAVSLVDVSAHSTALVLVGFPNISFSLQKIRELPKSKDIIIRCAVRVGTSYVSHSGTLTTDSRNAYWATLSMRLNRTATSEYLARQRKYLQTGKAQQHRYGSNSSEEENCSFSRNAEQNEPNFIDYDNATVDKNLKTEDFDEEDLEEMMLPMTLGSPGIRWTLCLHLKPDRDTALPSSATDPYGRRLSIESPLNKPINDLAELPRLDEASPTSLPNGRVKKLSCDEKEDLDHSSFTGMTGEILLIRLEADATLVPKYCLESVLGHVHGSHSQNSLCQGDFGHINTTAITGFGTSRNSQNDSSFFTHVLKQAPIRSISAKPPPNFLTYVALSETGLAAVEASGFIESIHLMFDQYLTCRTLQLRSYMWAVGHLASSELGAFFLAKHNILQRAISLAYEARISALKGSLLYALSLIPVTPRTSLLLKFLDWDLRAKGPMYLTRFLSFSSRLSNFNTAQPGQILSTQTPDDQFEKNNNEPETELSAASAKNYSPAVQARPALPISPFSKRLSQNNEAPPNKSLEEELQRQPLNNTMLTMNAYDLTTFCLSTSFSMKSIAQFGLDLLHLRQYRHGSEKNLVNPKFTTAPSSILYHYDTAYEKFLNQTSGVFGNIASNLPSNLPREYTKTFLEQYAKFDSFLLDLDGTYTPFLNDSNFGSRCLIVESVLPLTYIGFVAVPDSSSLRHSSENPSTKPVDIYYHKRSSEADDQEETLLVAGRVPQEIKQNNSYSSTVKEKKNHPSSLSLKQSEQHDEWDVAISPDRNILPPILETTITAENYNLFSSHNDSSIPPALRCIKRDFKKDDQTQEMSLPSRLVGSVDATHSQRTEETIVTSNNNRSLKSEPIEINAKHNRFGSEDNLFDHHTKVSQSSNSNEGNTLITPNALVDTAENNKDEIKKKLFIPVKDSLKETPSIVPRSRTLSSSSSSSTPSPSSSSSLSSLLPTQRLTSIRSDGYLHLRLQRILREKESRCPRYKLSLDEETDIGMTNIVPSINDKNLRCRGLSDMTGSKLGLKDFSNRRNILSNRPNASQLFSNRKKQVRFSETSHDGFQEITSPATISVIEEEHSSQHEDVYQEDKRLFQMHDSIPVRNQTQKSVLLTSNIAVSPSPVISKIDELRIRGALEMSKMGETQRFDDNYHNDTARHDLSSFECYRMSDPVGTSKEINTFGSLSNSQDGVLQPKLSQDSLQNHTDASLTDERSRDIFATKPFNQQSQEVESGASFQDDKDLLSDSDLSEGFDIDPEFLAYCKKKVVKRKVQTDALQYGIRKNFPSSTSSTPSRNTSSLNIGDNGNICIEEDNMTTLTLHHQEARQRQYNHGLSSSSSDFQGDELQLRRLRQSDHHDVITELNTYGSHSHSDLTSEDAEGFSESDLDEGFEIEDDTQNSKYYKNVSTTKSRKETNKNQQLHSDEDDELHSPKNQKHHKISPTLSNALNKACEEAYVEAPRDCYREMNRDGKEEIRFTPFTAVHNIAASTAVNGCVLPYQCYEERHREILLEIAELPNQVAAKVNNTIATLRKKRNHTPDLFLSVELWWRVQMLLRVYKFSIGHRFFLHGLFDQTLNSVEALLFLDLITQYVKWHCLLTSNESK